MSVRIHVKKPFRFSYPLTAGQRVAQERQFIKGVYEIEDGDPMLEHEFITKHFANGAIERPEETAARMESARAAAESMALSNNEALRQAEQAFARAAGAATRGALDAEKLQKALNTPVNELRASHGAGFDLPVGQQGENIDLNSIEVQKALNTPVDELHRQQQQDDDGDDGEDDDSTGETPRRKKRRR